MPQQQTFSSVTPIPPPADSSQQTFTDVMPVGVSSEEASFLKSNPGYKWMAADPKFPNRPEGIYPTGPGNEWRNDPTYAQSPVDLHLGRHTYEGAKAGAVAAAAPLALEATIPQLVGGVAGGAAGTAAGQASAKALGAGDTGQEVVGDVGGLLGGAAGSRVADVAASGARAIYEALPEELQSLLRKKALGIASPRLKNAIDFWDTLGKIQDRLNSPKSSAELDATGENKPYAGEPAPIPARWSAHDATGENKPFAGGMDEWNVPKPKRPLSDLDPVEAGRSAAPQPNAATVVTAPASSTPAATPAPVVSPPGSAGSMVRSVARSSGDPLLDRLRMIARQIEEEDRVENSATNKASAPEQDLTGILLESLKQVRAKKGLAVQ